MLQLIAGMASIGFTLSGDDTKRLKTRAETSSIRAGKLTVRTGVNPDGQTLPFADLWVCRFWDKDEVWNRLAR